MGGGLLFPEDLELYRLQLQQLVHLKQQLKHAQNKPREIRGQRTHFVQYKDAFRVDCID